MKYAGIGSRETPLEVCKRMTRIAKYLGDLGHTLRSGHGKGADLAFEEGALASKTPPEIFRDKDASDDAIKHAAQYHPAWHNCNDHARRLHGRNSMILLGRELDDPVDFVVCWTMATSQTAGGTAQGLRIAEDERYNIPVFNLLNPEDEIALIDFLEKHHADC